MKNSIEIMTMEHLSGDQREIAEIIGFENYRAFISFFGGGNIYIPTADSIMKAYRNSEIIKRYTGDNLRELAQEFDISIRTVQRIIADRGY